MMAEAEPVLLPTLAYRRLDVDASDPEFGFADAGISVLIETRTAERYRMSLGGLTPNRGGYYARLEGDPFVYVVVPQVLDYLRSIAAGDRIVRPISPEMQAAVAAVEETGEPESVTNPWLTQVLEVAP